jgi:hypothetical protein
MTTAMASSNCAALTFGVILFWSYLAFALKTGRVYGAGPSKPTYRADSPFSYWFMIVVVAGMAFMFSYWRLNCD